MKRIFKHPSYNLAVLTDFLSQINTPEFVPAGTVYGSDEYHNPLFLKHPIMIRSRKKGKEGLRFEMIGNELGDGAQGEVFHSRTLLIEQNMLWESLDENGNNKRVVKKMVGSNQEVRERILKEQIFSAQDEALSAKELVEYYDGNQLEYYMAMRLLPGKTLQLILLEDEIAREENDTANILTWQQRRDISQAIMNAVNSIGFNGVAHRDIKPSNLLVNIVPGQKPEVHFCDYGFGQFLHEDDHLVPGSYETVPPEATQYHKAYLAMNVQDEKLRVAMTHSLGVKGDVYSTGRLLRFLWGDSYSAIMDEIQATPLSKTNERLEFVEKERTGPLELPAEFPVIRLEMQTILDSMCAKNPDQRPSLNHAIKDFNAINWPDGKQSQSTIHSRFAKIFKYLNQLAEATQHLDQTQKESVHQLIASIRQDTINLYNKPLSQQKLEGARYRRDCKATLNQLKTNLQNTPAVYDAFTEERVTQANLLTLLSNLVDSICDYLLPRYHSTRKMRFYQNEPVKVAKGALAEKQFDQIVDAIDKESPSLGG